METQFRLQPAAAASAVNSAARPLLMPSSGHSAGSRGSIPKYFPETFTDFFSMLAEDEEHGEVITNLLEDKVIPRSLTTTPKREPPSAAGSNRTKHKCEKPFCCHNSSRSTITDAGNGTGHYLDSPLYTSGGGLTRTLSSKYYRRRPSQHRLLPSTDGGGSNLLDSAVGSGTSTGSSVASLNHNINGSNFGRSNSFRLPRPLPSVASAYSSYLSYQPSVVTTLDRSQHQHEEDDHHLPGTCKHIRYCCLHQGGGGDGKHPQSFQQSSATSSLSLNERTITTTPRLLPISPGGPSRLAIGHPHHHQKHHGTHFHQAQQQQQQQQDGINFSDDEKKSLIYPQLTAERYLPGLDADANQWTSLEQQTQRYSLLAKSYDQINRSRIFGECAWE